MPVRSPRARKPGLSRADEYGVNGAGDLDRLLDRARAGEPDAFGQIWEALGGRVLGYFRAHGCSDAEDLTSETFLAVFDRFDDIVGDGAAFRTWLFSVAHNKRVDDLRRRSRQPSFVSYEAELDRRLTPPADVPALAGTEDDVLAFLADLPYDQREVLVLRFVVDLSLEESARSMGRSVGAVKALQHRALESLRSRYGTAGLGRPGDSEDAGVSP